jgi:oxaloacetate decarboxylase alpha subunit/acetyl-CoA carboxylase biotin carboxyl carrier protein
LDLKEIRQIIELMKRHDLSLFHLERDGMKIKLKKGVDFDTFVNAVQHPSQAGSVAPMPHRPQPESAGYLPAEAGANNTTPSSASETEESSTSGPTFNSPMVGTFYRSPSPGDAPFVKEGDRFDEGQTICIIEAMKVMNEIKAESAGVVARVMVSDGTPVQFGQALFELK